MTMTATLQQTQTAQMGMPTPFVLTVLNSSGAPVNVNSIQAFVTTPQGSPATCANVAGPWPTVGTGISQVGGSQWNVQVPASGSVTFPFLVAFFGPAITGALASPVQQYFVQANVQTSDGSTFIPPPLQVSPDQPQLGPINAPAYTPPLVGQLNFLYPSQSSLAL